MKICRRGTPGGGDDVFNAVDAEEESTEKDEAGGYADPDAVEHDFGALAAEVRGLPHPHKPIGPANVIDKLAVHKRSRLEVGPST